MGTSAVGTELSTMLSQLLDDAEIHDLHRLSGGASRETWRFTADGRDLILQRQRAGDERDMLIEAGVVAAARRGRQDRRTPFDDPGRAHGDGGGGSPAACRGSVRKRGDT